MEARKRDNHTQELKKIARPYSPKLISEIRAGFLTAINTLHENGHKWSDIERITGTSTTHLKRLRNEFILPPFPAILHTANYLNVSLVELLALGQEDEV